MTEKDLDSQKIDRYFNKVASEEDVKYVHHVFGENEHEKELKSLLSGQFYELMAEDEMDKKNLDHILYKIHYNINTALSNQKKNSFDSIMKWTIRIAGILLLPVLIIWGIQSYNQTNLEKAAWVEIKAPAWTRAQFKLPDGTTGWLNSNSSIKYCGNFVHDRQIKLEGEVFFEVAKDKKRPFIVNANDIVVKVLGTRFNIASYQDDNNIEVVLEEGKLFFDDSKGELPYTMNPGDMVVYNKKLKAISTQKVQPEKYVSWTEGKLVFRNDPLDVIAKKLERWYDIEVEVDARLSVDMRLRATFKDEGLQEVLDILKRSLPINYRIEKRVIEPDATFSKKRVIFIPR